MTERETIRATVPGSTPSDEAVCCLVCDGSCWCSRQDPSQSHDRAEQSLSAHPLRLVSSSRCPILTPGLLQAAAVQSAEIHSVFPRIITPDVCLRAQQTRDGYFYRAWLTLLMFSAQKLPETVLKNHLNVVFSTWNVMLCVTPSRYIKFYHIKSDKDRSFYVKLQLIMWSEEVVTHHIIT